MNRTQTTSNTFDFLSAMEQHRQGRLPPQQVVQLFQWLIDHDVLLSTALVDRMWRGEAQELIASGWCRAKNEWRH